MSTDKTEVYIDEKAVAAIDAKIRESVKMTQGIMSSWNKPLEGVTEGPQGKVTIPKPGSLLEIPSGAKFMPMPSSGLISVPPQALKVFKQLLPMFEKLEVRMTLEQKKLFLDTLESMPTPKVMSDAKAIFTLMEALGK